MMEDSAADNPKYSAVRDASGKFITTQGRVPGSRNKASKASAAAIHSLHDLAFTKLRELLEAGHPSIVEFTVKSLLPSGGRAIQLDSLDADSLLDAVASGTISPNELRQIATALKQIREISDLQAVQERLAEIERLLKDGSL